ncbi:GDP-mannose 4,6-dehydratase [Metabacillus halosaccharovorans]|uniref:GDP-mannose 4,6-dehydratase n=1 Tax=Metabacillus halosaccharovorans TaxID=930124 RepID=UPI00203ADFE5|nr:GDP-mannose 4,6-dehydratase [Metabacillus halosaccharovorans]MCM3444718.1 GDP-mannose 4,6-dehydratase [Metabacillus halosaccharovorans]
MELNGIKIAVTGAGGFIGSHLVEALVKYGAEVTAFIHYNSHNDIGWIKELPEEYLDLVNIEFGDLTSIESVNRLIKGKKIVFHLGALISIPYSYINTRSYFKTNVEGTLNVLNACMENNVERVIHTSTSEVYGTPQSVPIDESFPLQAQSPYAASKISADKLVESYFLTHGLPVTTVRPFNTYGPRQSARAVIPTIITQFLTQNEVKLGALYPTRDFNYVSDTVNGFIAAAINNRLIGDTVNLGTGQEYSIKELVDLVNDILGGKNKVILDKERVRPEKSEVNRLLANSNKMQHLTNWSPKVQFKEGLIKTIEWTKSNIEVYRPNEYNI